MDTRAEEPRMDETFTAVLQRRTTKGGWTNVDWHE